MNGLQGNGQHHDEDDDELPELIAFRPMVGGSDQRTAVEENSDDELPPLMSSTGGQIATSVPPTKPSPKPEARPEARPVLTAPRFSARPGNLAALGSLGASRARSDGYEEKRDVAAQPRSAVPARPALARKLPDDPVVRAWALVSYSRWEDTLLAAAEGARMCRGDAACQAELLRASTRARIGKDDSDEALAEALSIVRAEIDSFVNSTESLAEGLALLAETEVLLAKALPGEAIRSAEMALLILQEVGDEQRQAAAHVALGSAQLDWAQNHRAVKSAAAAIALLPKDAQKLSLAEAQDLIRAHSVEGQAHLAQKKANEAVLAAGRAAVLAERLGDFSATSAACCVAAQGHLLKQNGAEAAIRAASRAVAFAKDAGNERQEATASTTLASAYISCGMVQEAFKAAREALSVARACGSTAQINSALEVIISIHMMDGNAVKALTASEEEVVHAKKAKHVKREAFALQKVALALSSQGRPREALRRASEARDLFRESKDQQGEAKALIFMAELHIKSKRESEALRSLKDAALVCREAGDVKTLVAVLQTETSLYLSRGDEENALRCAAAQVAAWHDSGYRHEEAQSLLGHADLVSTTKGHQSTESVKHARKALEIFEELEDKTSQVTAMLAVGNYYLAMGNCSEAMKLAKEARALAKAESDAILESSCLHMILNNYLTQSKFDEAIRVAKESVELCKKATDERGQAAAWQGLSQANLAASERRPGTSCLGDGLQAAESAMKLWKASGDKLGQAHAHHLLCTAQLYSKNIAAAQQHAQEMKDIAEELNEVALSGQAHMNLAQASLAAGCHGEAVKAAEEAVQIFQKIGDKTNLALAKNCKDIVTAGVEEARRHGRSGGRFQPTFHGGVMSMLQEGMVPAVGGAPVPARGFAAGVTSFGFGAKGPRDESQPETRKATDAAVAARAAAWGPVSGIKQSTPAGADATQNRGAAGL